MNKNIYEPAEDSQLILEAINNSSKNSSSFLEIGAGSGFVSNNLTNKFKTLTLSDINPHVISHLQSIFKDNPKITILESNLFENITEKYKTIIFNPPYLPSHPLDPDDWLNKALVGGKKGNEVIIKFLEKLPEHMYLDTEVFLLYSSLSKPEEIFKKLKEKALDYETINSISFDFEKLFVLKITKSEIYTALENPRLISQGKRGLIYKDNKKALKYNKRKDIKGNLKIEYQILKNLSDLDFVPKVIDYYNKNSEFFTYQFIEGEHLEDYLEKINSKSELIWFIRTAIKNIYKLDKKGIWKKEFNHPYKNIIVSDDVYFIDFERATHSKKRNLNQFLSFLHSSYMEKIYKKVNLKFEFENLFTLEKEYKNNIDIIDKILDFFSI